jgi:hypothetical protein
MAVPMMFLSVFALIVALFMFLSWMTKETNECVATIILAVVLWLSGLFCWIIAVLEKIVDKL